MGWARSVVIVGRGAFFNTPQGFYNKTSVQQWFRGEVQFPGAHRSGIKVDQPRGFCHAQVLIRSTGFLSGLTRLASVAGAGTPVCAAAIGMLRLGVSKGVLRDIDVGEIEPRIIHHLTQPGQGRFQCVADLGMG